MTPKDAINIFKRFLIVFVLVGVPLICILTFAVKLKSIYVILISVLVVGGIFIIEEILYNKRMNKKQERREKESRK